MIYPIKGLQRLLSPTLLEDFNTLLEVCLVKGLQNIHLECTLLEDFLMTVKSTLVQRIYPKWYNCKRVTIELDLN